MGPVKPSSPPRHVAGGLALCALALGVGCKNGDASAPAAAQAAAPSKAGGWAPARVAELYFTTEVLGHVEPCGCTTEPLGGIQRLATVLQDSPAPHGLIDAGNLLFPKEVSETTRQQHLLKSHILARAYRHMGALALNVAESDLVAGAQHLKGLQHEGAVPFVSANVRPKGAGAPEIARSFVRTLGGIKFGLTGVATPEEVARHSADVTVIEYVPSLRSEVKVLREAGAEVVVVLAHLGEAGAMALAEQVPDVDVVVRAPGTPIERAPSPPKRVGGVLVVEAGSQGQRVGRLRFAFGESAPERPIPLDDAGAKAEQQRARSEKKLDALRVQREAWAANPAQAEAVKALDARIARLEATIAAPAAPAAPPDHAHVRVELVPLGTDVASHPVMEELLAGYYQKLQKMNLTKGDPEKCKPSSKSAPTFVGTAKCAECHEEAYAFWKKTKHAKAWETLEDDGKQYDLTCVGCHVVGYEQPGGFCRLTEVEGFEDVGCENCHGPGSAHAQDQDPDSIVLASTRDTCAGRCHVPEHSDAFEYDGYLRKITGEGHELSED